ncbi:hypothetical protein QZH41_017743 [Actinostola sp. cb2023]|nr:hypothetical protein QZH41_017743 [Actinostola sp. cb2023]
MEEDTEDSPQLNMEEMEEQYQQLGEDDIEAENPNPRLDFEGKDQREEPKGIVFLSNLLLLFKFCNMCFAPDPKANEVGSSSAMEFAGHQRTFEFLLTTGIIITTFVSDRHASIAKWMREELPRRWSALGKPIVNHFFDLWHIGKKIQKTLIKLSKENGCELIGRWRKACVRHFYWSVMSTHSLLGEVKVAKFHTFLSHILNVHTHLPNRLFNACAHGAITKPKVWMTKGSEAYGKLYDVLTNTILTKAIKKASSVGQTSCLESYHSVINQFAPKMLSFSYLGMLGRTILAALHFNYNISEDNQR